MNKLMSMQMEVALEPESIPEWNLVGQKKYDYKEHWGGDYVHFFSAITPLETEAETSVFIKGCCLHIAQWLLAHRNDYSNKDRFQIGIGWSEKLRPSGREIVKTGGTWEDVELLAAGELEMKFFPGWSNGIFNEEYIAGSVLADINDTSYLINRLGRTSLYCGVVSFIMVMGIYPLMVWLDQSGAEIPEPWQTVGILYMPLAGLLSLTAIVLGVVGLFRKQRKRCTAIAGLCLGLASIGLFTAIVIYAFMVSD